MSKRNLQLRWIQNLFHYVSNHVFLISIFARNLYSSHVRVCAGDLQLQNCPFLLFLFRSLWQFQKFFFILSRRTPFSYTSKINNLRFKNLINFQTIISLWWFARTRFRLAIPFSPASVEMSSVDEGIEIIMFAEKKFTTFLNWNNYMKKHFSFPQQQNEITSESK